MLRLFRGTCEAVRAMHTYRAHKGSQAQQQTRQTGGRSEHIPESSKTKSRQNGNFGNPVMHGDSDDEEDEDGDLPRPDGDGDGGYSYSNDAGSSIPLVAKHAVEDEGDVIFDGDQELDNQNSSSEPELVPFAHRDMKPGYVGIHKQVYLVLMCSGSCRNVMIADDGSPILMDFGSTMKARIKIENRQQALLQQVLTTSITIVASLNSLLSGYCCGAEYNGVSCSRTFRRENRSYP